MFVNTVPRSWLIGGWFATLAVILTVMVANGASLSTSALILVVGVAPAVIVMMLAGRRSDEPTVAQILHPADAKDRR